MILPAGSSPLLTLLLVSCAIGLLALPWTDSELRASVAAWRSLLSFSGRVPRTPAVEDPFGISDPDELIPAPVLRAAAILHTPIPAQARLCAG